MKYYVLLLLLLHAVSVADYEQFKVAQEIIRVCSHVIKQACQRGELKVVHMPDIKLLPESKTKQGFLLEYFGDQPESLITPWGKVIIACDCSIGTWQTVKEELTKKLNLTAYSPIPKKKKPFVSRFKVTTVEEKIVLDAIEDTVDENGIIEKWEELETRFRNEQKRPEE